jgi:glycosyltransferase involved in cell wall biosynthesis
VKVLIIHQHFNTPEKGGAIRSYYLAKALSESGHSVSVVTGYGEKNYSKVIVEGIEVHYLPVPYHNRFDFAARSTAFLKFVSGVVRRPALYRNVDVCYAISVPLTVGLAALWIKRRFKIPYFFEVGDLWPDAPVQMGFVKNYFFKAFLYALEKSIYKNSQGVIALSPSIKRAIEEKVPRKTIHLLPNMSDTDYYKPEAKIPALEERFKVSGKFVVSYVGAIGLANGLDYYLECARASQRADLPVHFILCGDGALVENLKKSAEHLMLKNFTYVPFQNRDGVREVMNITDATFICYKNVPILETGSPNKYFDGLAAGKLVIINFGGWIKEEIEKEQCGVQIDPKHPTDFVKKIQPFIKDYGLLHRFQNSARALAERKYSRIELSKKFETLIRRNYV